MHTNEFFFGDEVLFASFIFEEQSNVLIKCVCWDMRFRFHQAMGGVPLSADTEIRGEVSSPQSS